jgi:hypothetical protein
LRLRQVERELVDSAPVRQPEADAGLHVILILSKIATCIIIKHDVLPAHMLQAMDCLQQPSTAC